MKAKNKDTGVGKNFAAGKETTAGKNAIAAKNSVAPRTVHLPTNVPFISKMMRFPKDSEIRESFRQVCGDAGVSGSKKEMESLVIYDMTDGTRTSTDLKGEDAYFDGGLFCLRLIHFLNALGAKNVYINVIHEGHKKRANYEDIYKGMKKHVGVYAEFAKKYNVRLKFLGDYTSRIEPLKLMLRGRIGKDKTSKMEASYRFDFRSVLGGLEKITAKNAGLAAYFLINYSTKWADKKGARYFRKLPNVNAVIRHTKGYINGDMWIFDKFDNHTLVYAQNGSSSVNWSDRQLLYLIALSLRSVKVNEGFHLSKKYAGSESEIIRENRERKLELADRDFYGGAGEKKLPKRVIIFGPYGPEIYKF